MKAESRNKEAWVQAALERYELPLVRYAAAITGDADLARDVVQDTFLRLCNADRAKVDSHLGPWLYTVCRNRAFDVRKKEGRMVALTDDAAAAHPNGGPGPRAMAQRHEAQDMVLEVVQSLPENQQEAFRLKFNDELTYREISEIMGISLGTVSHLITTALTAVRQRLSADMDLAQEV